MTLRWTEEEAKAHGYRKDAKGEWYWPSSFNRPDGRPVRARGLEQKLRDNDPGPVSESECSVREEPEEQTTLKKAGEAENQASIFRIVVIAYRKRHLDPDNLCPKWYIDELVKQNIIPDDSSRYVQAIEKRVMKTTGPERTVIQVYRGKL